MEQEQQGPQNTIQFLTMMITSLVKGIPQMLKSMIITSVLSGVVTLAAHFYLLLVPNDGYNTGNPMLTPILVLANVQPTPPNVLLFWFLANYIFWMVIGTFKEYGILGGVKQFVTTPIFAINGLRESGFGAFPMLMGGLGFAFLLRLWILGTMTTLQMFLMMIGVLVSQENSITLIGMELFMTDIRKLVNRDKEIQDIGFGLPSTLILGAILGFAYLVFFPYNVQMVQVLLALMVLGIIGMFVQGRRKGTADQVALALMLLCAFSLMAMPVNADDGGAAESGGAQNVINNVPLRNYMISQGINPAIAGIAASLVAQGKMTPKIFEQLKKGKIKVTSDMSIQEMQTMQKVRTKVLTNLQKMEREVMFGKANKLWKPDGEKGNILEHTDKMINDLLKTGEVDINKYGKIYTVYTGHVTGRTITPDMVPTSGQLWRETISNTVNWTTREVITGQTIDGETSYKSMILRTIIGGATGGASEYVYTPANSIYAMKRYVDAGGNSIIGGWMAAGKQVIIDEATGRVIGGVMKYGGKAIIATGKGVWAGGKYIVGKIPGALKATSNGLRKAGNAIKSGVKKGMNWFKKGGTGTRTPKTSGATGQVDEMLGKIRQKNTTGSPYPDLEVDFKRATGKNIDIDGMTTKDIKALRMTCDKHGISAKMRPTTKNARKFIKDGRALPKPEAVKNKTINRIDTEYLGFNQADEGLAACKRPKPLPKQRPSNLSPDEWRGVKRRWVQREREFRNMANKIEKNPDLTWSKDTGIIYDKKTGLPFTGDNDAFVFVDATTGKPVSPYTNQKIVKELKELGVIQHGEHANWDYSGSSRTVKPGARQSPWQQNKTIDKKIIGGHMDGGEPLNSFNPTGNTSLRNLTEDQLRNLNIDPEYIIPKGGRAP